jgi:hypothetical protein
MAEIQQYDQRTHVLERPYVYRSSGQERSYGMGYEESKTMVKRDISFSSALMKIVDEILVNALDRVAHNNTPKSSTTSKKTSTSTTVGFHHERWRRYQRFTLRLRSIRLNSFWSTPDFFQL